MTRRSDLRSTFLSLHHEPPATPTPRTLAIPNPWDVGSARLLQQAGARALATTSAGFAASLGRLDQNVTRDEVLAHAVELAAAVDIPLSVDAEGGFGQTPAEVAESIALFAATDVAGCSIEDWDASTQSIRSLGDTIERFAAARGAADDLVLTGRADGLIHGNDDLDDAIVRLQALRDAGADVVYAPGLVAAADIARVVDELGVPVNVLALPGTPSIPELAELGVARVSVGNLFTSAAYGALMSAAHEMLGPGTHTYVSGVLDGATSRAAFAADTTNAGASQ
ncbi:MAG: isocitrate lyase/phosphoenolpyruvate mutase family protein [Ilumatobacter sp.]